MSVGLIGLGNMGRNMANRLITQYSKPQLLSFYDILPANIKALESSGMSSSSACSNVSELAKKSDVIITMLPATQHVEGTLRGNNGVFANAKKGSIIIDCSTIDPIASKRLSEEAKSHGHHMIDAPVIMNT